jgi:hypothetical protein
MYVFNYSPAITLARLIGRQPTVRTVRASARSAIASKTSLIAFALMGCPFVTSTMLLTPSPRATRPWNRPAVLGRNPGCSSRTTAPHADTLEDCGQVTLGHAIAFYTLTCWEALSRKCLWTASFVMWFTFESRFTSAPPLSQYRAYYVRGKD